MHAGPAINALLARSVEADSALTLVTMWYVLREPDVKAEDASQLMVTVTPIASALLARCAPTADARTSVISLTALQATLAEMATVIPQANAPTTTNAPLTKSVWGISVLTSAQQFLVPMALSVKEETVYRSIHAQLSFVHKEANAIMVSAFQFILLILHATRITIAKIESSATKINVLTVVYS